MKQLIYLDNAATTRTAPEVVEAMLPYLSEHYGNPSSIYSLGTESKKAVNGVREIIAESLGAANNEIYFTAGERRATTGPSRRLPRLMRRRKAYHHLRH